MIRLRNMMYHQTFVRYLYLILATILSACTSTSPTSDSNQLQSTNTISPGGEPNATPESAPSPLVTNIPTVLSQTVTYEPTLSPFPSVTPVSSPIPTITPWGISLVDSCPSIVTSNAPSLLAVGSILFYIEPNLWAISNKSPTPSLVYSIPENQFAWVYLLMNTTQVLLYLNPEASDGYAIIYDLESQGVIGSPIAMPSTSVVGWLPDGRLKLLESVDHILGIGVNRKFVLVDPITQDIEVIDDNLDLPNYQFESAPFYNGIASTDPTEQLVLYTAWSQSNTPEIALLDRQNSAKIWRRSVNLPPYPYPEPDWATDGNHVLFSVYMVEKNKQYNKLVSLNRDGETEPLPPQPFPYMTNWQQIQDLSWSPDRRYIHYHLGYFNQDGPGVMVDTLTGWAGEICNPEATFIDGEWITETQFLYSMKSTNGNESLRLLDIPSWETQVLTESGPTVFGWTPVEFP